MEFYRYEQTLNGLNQEVRGPLYGFSSLRFDVRGTFTGTLVVEATLDDVNWTTLTVFSGVPLTTPSLTTNITSNGNWATANLTGYSQFRIRCSAYTSGSMEIVAVVSDQLTFQLIGVTGTATVQDANVIFWTESSTAQAISATVTGTSRDTGGSVNSNVRYAMFNVLAYSDRAGTVRIEASNNNSTWFRATTDTVVAADTPVHISVPVTTRYYRAVYVNGAISQTVFALNTSFTPS